MKLVAKKDANTIDNSETCTVLEYPINEKDINGSVISVKGRYPESGYAVNEVCKEVVYITEGVGRVVMVDDTEVVFRKGDTLFLDRNEKYYWEGDFESFMVCTPAFYPEQHKIVKE